MNKLKKTTLCLAIALATLSCKDENRNDNNQEKEQISSLSNLFQTFKDEKIETKTFEFKNEDGITTTGTDGVTITISPNSTSDVGPDENLILNLTEYLTPKDMFYGQVFTESNGQILVTGGSFNIEINDSNGNEVDVPPYYIQSSIDIQTDITSYENDMIYFTGTPTTTSGGLEIVNWHIETDSIEGSFIDNSGVFNVFGTLTGFSNCDAFLQIEADQRTQFKLRGVTSDNSITIDQQSAYIFAQDLPSVISVYTQDGQYFKTYDNSVPIGYNATLLIIAQDSDGYLMAGTSNVTVQGDDVFDIEVTYTTTDDLTELIDSL